MRDQYGTDAERRRQWRGPHPATIAARLILLVLVGGLSVEATQETGIAMWAVLLGVAGIPAVLAPQHPIIGPLTRMAEVLVTGLAADVVVAHATPGNELFRGGGAAAAVLPYLLVPIVAAALYRRRLGTRILLRIATAGAGGPGGVALP